MAFRKTKLALLSAPLGTSSVAYCDEATLPQINVQCQAERADGPVTDYRATRSATATKTNTALRSMAPLSGYMQGRRSTDISGRLSDTTPLFN